MIQPFVSDWVQTKEIQLPQGYGMIFLTNALLGDIADLTEPSDALYEPVLQAFAERANFTAGTKFLLEKYPFPTKLVYIKIGCIGSIGTQTGALYENGRIPIGPLEGNGSINLLLKTLGVWLCPTKMNLTASVRVSAAAWTNGAMEDSNGSRNTKVNGKYPLWRENNSSIRGICI